MGLLHAKSKQRTHKHKPKHTAMTIIDNCYRASLSLTQENGF